MTGQPGQARGRRGSSAVRILCGALGLVACLAAVYLFRPLQWHIVTYDVRDVGRHDYVVPTFLHAALLALLVAGALIVSRRTSSRIGGASALLWPLVAAAPAAIAAAAGTTMPFYFGLMFIVGFGWAGGRVAMRWLGDGDGDERSHRSGAAPDEARGSEATDDSPVRPRGNDSMESSKEAPRRAPAFTNGWAYVVLALSIAMLSFLHAGLQINFFEHFMLGHADFGHFTEELKNALAGRGLRCDSFPNTRLGWHFVPLLYLLVPGYALWPSPVYVMVVGAVVVHLPAVVVYAAARQRSGSILVGFLFALAWSLLPSVSRLIYSNTYGFQWIYVAMPVIAAMIAAGLAQRWRLSMALAIVVLLCKETAAAATLGWSLYMLLFTPRKKSGAALAIGSIVYAWLCMYVVIPWFAASGTYERASLFGALGASIPAVVVSMFTQPGEVVARLLRVEALYFLAMLVVPLAILPLKGWRVLVAAAPSLLLMILLENADWLSLKFWHHATVLPVVMLAGVAALEPADGSKVEQARRARNHFMAGAVVFAVACSHLLFAFSPIAKSYQVYAAGEALHRPDPRMAMVRLLRREFPRSRTVLATERMAAHFTDYKRLYTGSRVVPADVVVIDRSDRWDTTGLPGRAPDYRRDPNYRLFGVHDSVVVFVRADDAPPLTLEE